MGAKRKYRYVYAHLVAEMDKRGILPEDLAKASACYYGEEVMLIGGKFGYEYGEDEDEIIIESANVIGIVA